MPRLPQAEIDRVKREVDLAAQVRRCGIELKRHGKDLIGLCPFHDDRSPSLVITPRKNLWHCLGACGEGGSVIDWVMKIEGISFRQAVELLRQGWEPTVEAKSEPVVTQSTRLKMEPLVTSEMTDEAMMAAVVGFYHQTLLESPEALDYLAQRGLGSKELIEHFQIGYANRTIGYRVPKRNWSEGAAVRDRLQALGLFRSTGHEFFTGSIVVPVFDGAGRVVEMYGRQLVDDSRNPSHKYLPGPHAGVFNLAGLRDTKEVILCEALFDALTFWQAGFRNVTSAYGVHGFTAEMLEAFRAYGIERVLIAYDRDRAGEAAAEELAEELLAEGLECFRVQFPRGMDANDYARTTQPASKSLGLVIRQAAWLGQGRGPGAPGGDAEGDQGRAAKKEKQPVDALPAEAEPEVPASPIPEPPAAEVDAQIGEDHDQVVIVLGDRRYRVRGLSKNLAYDVMKVNLLASRQGALHADSFDLYAARARAAFVKQAAKELQVPESRLKKDLGQVMLKLEELQEEQIRAATSPADEEAAPEMTSEEEAAALELLRSPRLLDRILEDFRRCGVVGEETNKLVGYLAAVSRKLHAPLAVIIQSSSAAGKTSLMEAVLSFMPEEERVQYSAMTGQSLFYMGETDLAHKILAIVEEEGAERASYALKLLQSEGELTIASTGKNPRSGRLETQEYRVEGPVMILLTTTAIDLDEELLNRCLVLSVDEGREQTRAIHRLQRERRTLDGLFAQESRSDVRRVHRNAQRMLRPLPVVNPWAPALTFVDDRTRTRRDHEKYLTLIDTIALLHQFQREVKVEERGGRVIDYVEVELGDLEIANRLAADVLGRSLDELPPQTRRFLQRLDVWVAGQCEELEMDRVDFRFTAREVRAALGTGPTQTWTHLGRLAELEYLVAHHAGRGQITVYELIYYGADDDRDVFLPGLLDVDKLRKSSRTRGNLSGSEGSISGETADLSAPFRPHFGAISDPGKRPDPNNAKGSGPNLSVSPEITTRRDTKTRTSRRTVTQDSA